jgi:hypothetical protein
VPKSAPRIPLKVGYPASPFGLAKMRFPGWLTRVTLQVPEVVIVHPAPPLIVKIFGIRRETELTDPIPAYFE